MVFTGKLTFLRIGKTGTTALRIPIAAHIAVHPDARIKVVGHNVLLRDMLPPEMGAIALTIREPVSRYVSAFNSRLRMGKPRYDNPWNKAEAKAFGLFKTPNMLAEALYSDDQKTRKRARKAMEAIRMVKKGYAHFLESIELLETMKDRIVFIGAQEHLASDFELFKKLLGMDPSLTLPEDDIASHRTPAGYEKTVSELGRANLARFLEDDYKLYEWCADRRLELAAAHESAEIPAAG